MDTPALCRAVEFARMFARHRCRTGGSDIRSDPGRLRRNQVHFRFTVALGVGRPGWHRGIRECGHGARAPRLRNGQGVEHALLIEGEAVVPIQDKYRPDPTSTDHSIYPVVADPEAYEFNRFQLTNTSLPGTTLTLGRQRIGLDDQRFVGGVAWRQNEQTFDALAHGEPQHHEPGARRHLPESRQSHLR